MVTTKIALPAQESFFVEGLYQKFPQKHRFNSRYPVPFSFSLNPNRVNPRNLRLQNAFIQPGKINTHVSFRCLTSNGHRQFLHSFKNTGMQELRDSRILVLWLFYHISIPRGPLFLAGQVGVLYRIFLGYKMILLGKIRIRAYQKPAPSWGRLPI